MKPKKLQIIAPILNNIRKKSNPFNVPGNYFETFEVGVLAELHAENFSFSSNKTSFLIPDDYLNTLEDQLITNIKSEAIQLKKSNISEDYFEEVEKSILKKLPKNKKTRITKKITISIVSLVFAASLALFMYLNNTPKETTSFDSIALSDIEQSINNGLIDINQVTLVAAFPNLDVDTEDIMSTITDDEILDFLNIQDIDHNEFEN